MDAANESVTLTETLTPIAHYDVIVAGGGVAGCAAAVQCAKAGKRTLLLEKTTLLGGLATIGLINYFVPLCNGRGRQIIFGLCDKWLHDSIRYGYDSLPEAWKDGEPKAPTGERLVSLYSPNLFALQLAEEVTAAGVDLFYDSITTTPVMDRNRVRGVVADAKDGRRYYTCRMLIDTTGDGDLLRRTGAPFAAGRNYNTYLGKQISLASARTAVEKGDVRYLYERVAGGCVDLYGHGQPDNVPRYHGLSADDVTAYLLRNQRAMLETYKTGDRRTRDLALLPTMPQFRTTCHLVGDETFRETDAYRHRADSVCVINDFDRRDYLYEVPLGCLCRRDFPNLLTAGRSASAEGYGWDVLRVIPPAILTGQAAALAACHAIDEGCGAGDVDVPRLRAAIERDAGIPTRFDDALVPKDGKGGEHVDVGHL